MNCMAPCSIPNSTLLVWSQFALVKVKPGLACGFCRVLATLEDTLEDNFYIIIVVLYFSSEVKDSAKPCKY